VDEAMITEETHLPVRGELGSKNMHTKDIPWLEFLVSSEIAYNPKGMHFSQIKNKWRSFFVIIKCYITCEGSLSLDFYYHFPLLMVCLVFELNLA
jgi:hypothetical protein